jgi:hypothetical protein
MEMKKESRHALLQHELTSELKALRQSVRETAAGFILCKEGEIEALLDYLLKMSPGRLKDIARPWLRETGNLKLKPDKGRLKDLKKIDHLLHDLQSSVIESDNLEQKPKPVGKKIKGGADKKSPEKKAP